MVRKVGGEKLEKRRLQRMEWNRSGLCGACGGERDNPDYKLCSNCREIGRRSDRKLSFRATKRRWKNNSMSVED